MFAQGEVTPVNTPMAASPPGLSHGTLVRSGTLRDAIGREAERLAGGLSQGGPSSAPQPAGSRSWIARHPVLAGALIGTGGGVAIDTATCGWGGGGCGFTYAGAGAGAFVGLLGSARRKPEFTSPSSSTQPDVAGVERVVRALGVSERIVLTDVNGKEIRGSIQAIGQDGFAVLPSGESTSVDIAFSQVRTVKKKGLGTGAKIGIAAGVVAIGVTVYALACYSSGCAGDW
jgi:hypothetical protein